MSAAATDGAAVDGLLRLGMGEANNNVSLGELNNINNYALFDKLQAFYGNDVDSNPYLQINIDSIFHDMSSFIQAFANSLFPIYLSMNIRSLQANHCSLNNFLENLFNANIPIDIIAVQEIWQLPQPEVIKITNFTFVFKQRSAGRGGGVGFYINNRLGHKIRNELSFFQDKVSESITVEITDGKKSS